MFAKLINILLVYLMVVINITLLLLPPLFFFLAFFIVSHPEIIHNHDFIYKVRLLVIFAVFMSSLLMLIYLLLDFIFGFSVRFSLKNCQRYEKFSSYDFLTDIFEQVKSKFMQPRVRLYIKNSQEINAFAVASFGSKAIVLTHGMIKHYLNNCDNHKDFIYAIRSIIAHEMSHLVNKDFLPTLLIIANRKATNVVVSLCYLAINLFGKLFYLLLREGFVIKMINFLHNIFGFFLGFFNRVVVFNIYRFIGLSLSRSIEYRCDFQATQAFGGKRMAFALSLLGKSGYFTLFSTHPSTKSRIDKVANVVAKEGVVLPRIVDELANYIAMIFLFIVVFCLASECGIDRWLLRYLLNFV